MIEPVLLCRVEDISLQPDNEDVNENKKNNRDEDNPPPGKTLRSCTRFAARRCDHKRAETITIERGDQLLRISSRIVIHTSRSADIDDKAATHPISAPCSQNRAHPGTPLSMNHSERVTLLSINQAERGALLNEKQKRVVRGLTLW